MTPEMILAGIIGLLAGSFLNVCIARWPADESVVAPRSRCPKCGTMIGWYDNIPVVSWVMLRARCRNCALPIPIRYPLVELATGIIWVWAMWRYGVRVEMLRAAVFMTILLGISMTDASEYYPREFSIGGMVLGCASPFRAGGALRAGPRRHRRGHRSPALPDRAVGRKGSVGRRWGAATSR